MRRHVLVIGFVCVACLAPSLAGQAPLTTATLDKMLGAAARVSHSLDSLTRNDTLLEAKAVQLVADFKDHNAEPCEYPQGHPELCADYDMQRFMLNNRSADLQKAMKASAADRHALQGDFATLMTALQRAKWGAEVSGRREQLLTCSRMPLVHEAARCLSAAVRR